MKWYNIIKGLTPEEEAAADDFLIAEGENPLEAAFSPPTEWVEPGEAQSLASQKAEKEISRLLEEIEAAQQEIKDLRKLVEEEEWVG